MRSLVLAEQFREQGVTVFFALRQDEGQATKWLLDKGFEVLQLSHGTDEPFVETEDAQRLVQVIQEKNLRLDWVIVDHYQLGAVWERQVASQLGVRIGVIDDLANRSHDCQILLDQNFVDDFKERYQGLVPSSCIQLLGPSYLILRPEFYQVVRSSRNREKRILIFFGGSDPTDETGKVLQALQAIRLTDWQVDVVVGKANPKIREIARLCQQIGAAYHCQIDYLAELMSKAAFSLGAGGVTMWERCFLGLPSLVTIVVENQRQSALATARFGAIKLLGWHEEVTVTDYKQAILWAINRPHELQGISQRAIRLMHGEYPPESDENSSRHLHPFVATILEGRA